MDQVGALRELEDAIRQIPLLRKLRYPSAGHTRWRTNLIDLLQDIFGDHSRIYQSLVNIDWTFHGPVEFREGWLEYVKQQKNRQAYLEGLTKAEGILNAAIDQIVRKGVNGVHASTSDEKQSVGSTKILSLLEHELRKTFREAPTQESEVLDAIEDLFIGAGLGNEFVRETESIPYSSKSYIPDYAFNGSKTIVEAKLCDSPKREKQIIGEINDDILAYGTAYSHLIFLVYDLGSIRDQDKFKKSIQNNRPNIVVSIIKH